MASSGVHSNGFSLVRKVFDMKEEALKREYDSLGCSLGEALLEMCIRDRFHTKGIDSTVIKCNDRKNPHSRSSNE